MSDRIRITLSLLTALLLSVGAPETATAQTDDEPTPEALQEAGKYFQSGAEAYTAGNYSKAIVEFLKAYNAVPNALFLYNISLSYGKLGNVPDALAAARKARGVKGMDDKTANRNEARIAAYERWTSAADVAADVQKARAVSQSEQDATDPSATETTAATTTTSGGGRFGGLGWMGAGLMIVGGGMSIGSGVVASGLRQPIEDFKKAGAEGDDASYEQLKSEIRSDQNLGRALLFVGAPVAATGLVLFLIDLTNGPRDTAAFVSPTADGAIAGIHASF
jgi:tetratricopeptide (TPR) repeat protein